MIKYLGSKRRLIPLLSAIAEGSGATSAVDLFAGTTRVSQAFKKLGIHTTCNDTATYSEVFGQCFITTDAATVDQEELADLLAMLQALPPQPGYFTETFCQDARYLQPHNGARVDAIRNYLAENLADHPYFPLLLTSLILGADRVDSTTGLQMAYLKGWSPRSFNDLELRVPDLLPGVGLTHRRDASTLVGELPPTDLLYLDPPYNQHRYFTNYHVWETLVRWDQPEAYGVARKRVDAKDPQTASPYNRRREILPELRRVLQGANAEMVAVSFNDEGWITREEMTTALEDAGFSNVQVIEVDYPRYVGAKIGIHNPAGKKVGTVGKVRNCEQVFLGGDAGMVEGAVAAAGRMVGG